LGRNANELSNADGVITAGAENYALIYGDFSQFVIVDRFPSQIEIIPNLFGAARRPTGQRGAFYGPDQVRMWSCPMPLGCWILPS
jgi:predicted phage gp36 major capsid-like protein